MIEVPTTEPPLFRDRLGWYLGISSYWFSVSFKWFLVLQLMPLLVGGVVPESEKNLWWGRINGVGAIEAMIGPALFGWLSDRWRSRWGRRRPFIALGAGLTAIALLFLGSADRLWMYFAGYLALQISDDIATGPYAAIIPDMVPSERRGRASGIMSQLQLLAQVAAAIVGFALSKNIVLIFVSIAAINIVCAIIVLVTMRERSSLLLSPPERAVTFRPAAMSHLRHRIHFAAAEWAAPWRSHDFRWVWLTRFLNALGFYVVLTYMPNYLADVVRVYRLPTGHVLTDTLQAAIFLSLLLSLFGACSAIAGGALADRLGRKRVVYFSGWMMFTALLPFALFPNYSLILTLTPLFGLGYGAYISATWALAADVLPSPEDAAKDMGIWQMSVAAPQIVAGFVVSLLIHLGNRHIAAGAGYSIAFVLAAFTFLAGSVLVMRVKGST